VLDVALEHHLTSRLTSLVAVDVTPSRPLNDGLNSARVPLNLPDGWVYDKVFGEQRGSPSADQHAQALPPPAPPPPAAMPAPAAMTRLVMAKAPAAAVAPADQGVTLPQTGSEGPLMLIAGLTLLLLAGALMLRERSNADVSR
jgi:Ca-activated chloride channel family protein